MSTELLISSYLLRVTRQRHCRFIQKKDKRTAEWTRRRSFEPSSTQLVTIPFHRVNGDSFLPRPPLLWNIEFPYPTLNSLSNPLGKPQISRINGRLSRRIGVYGWDQPAWRRNSEATHQVLVNGLVIINFNLPLSENQIVTAGPEAIL